VKLSISNIGWENSELDEHLKLIRECGCHGVELAASCIWSEPIDTSKKERKELKDKINNAGLEVAGLHALLFTRPDLEILGTDERRDKAADYLGELFELCHDLGGKVLVYGSPRSRRLQGQEYDEAMSITADFFRRVAPKARLSNVYLCIEPLSEKETDFIQLSREGADLVKRVNHPNFQLHLDAAAMAYGRESFHQVFSENKSIIKHFHVSEPGLVPAGTTDFDHGIIGKELKAMKYDGYVSIEMRRGFGSSKKIVKQSIEYVKDKYDISSIFEEV